MRSVLVLIALLALSSSGVPQPPLPLTPLSIVSGARVHAFKVEVADTDATRNAGLMFRQSLGPRRGMLFDYGEIRVGVAFWMKDTLIPLDIIFIDGAGRIVRIETMATPKSEEPIPAGAPVRAVLELAGGTASRLGIGAGDSVRHEIFNSTR
jgi:hypothetical protein